MVRPFAEAMRGCVEPVHGEDVTLAAELVDRNPGVRAWGPLHAAVMQRLAIEQIISTDTDFDRMEGIDRLEPSRIEELRGAIPTVDEDSSSDVRQRSGNRIGHGRAHRHSRPRYRDAAAQIPLRYDNFVPKANITNAVRDFLILTGLV